MRKNYKRWTNDEESVLISMRKSGKTCKEIAKTLKRTEQAVFWHCHKLIDECKLEKKTSGPTRILDYDRIAQYVSENPANIRACFKKYADEVGVKWTSVQSAYYSRSYSRTQERIKDRGNLFTIVGKKGHTTNNDKNSDLIKTSNLWEKMKDWLLSSLLS